MAEQFSGVQKAAILLIALGPEKSATIFKHLKEEEIEEEYFEKEELSPLASAPVEADKEDANVLNFLKFD